MAPCDDRPTHISRTPITDAFEDPRPRSEDRWRWKRAAGFIPCVRRRGVMEPFPCRPCNRHGPHHSATHIGDARQQGMPALDRSTDALEPGPSGQNVARKAERNG
eukprot:scaffold846_cov336-Pavlova_lutheri.AAC.9